MAKESMKAHWWREKTVAKYAEKRKALLEAGISWVCKLPKNILQVRLQSL
jgi:small subunit ribosomal protein S14